MAAHSTTKIYEVLPAAADGAAVIASGSSFGNSAWTQISAAELTDIDIIGIATQVISTQPFEVDIGIGASASEVVVTTFRVHKLGVISWWWPIPHPVPIRITSGQRIAVRMRISGTAGLTHHFKLGFIRQ